MIWDILRRIFDSVYYSARYIDGCQVVGKISGIQNVKFGGKNKIPNGCSFSGNVFLDYRTTVGINNWIHGNVKIGKYCQIGANVMINSTNHPINYISTYINSELFKGDLYELKETKSISIGHDVWIGHGAIILGGASIGNGAIIAAGAVVTKDVPNYSIAAGIPATIKGTRFNENICKELEELKWWDKSDAELEKIKPLFFKNLKEANSLYE